MVIMFYDVLLFIYLSLLVLKVFVLLNDVHPSFCLRIAGSNGLIMRGKKK